MGGSNVDEYTRTIIGIALTAWGLGVIMCGLAWAWTKHRELNQVKAIMNELFGHAGRGHVVDYHQHGPDHVHAHCLCGETSLLYSMDDPTAERLMEGWAENHIDTLMESIER